VGKARAIMGNGLCGAGNAAHALERISVIGDRLRRVGKAKRADLPPPYSPPQAEEGREGVGTAREERAFAHPTRGSNRSKSSAAELRHLSSVEA